MSNWWIDNQGRNNLKGVPDDPSNPPILKDERIVTFLLEYPQAKTDFLAILPSMLPEEQDRLNELVAKNPFCMAHNVIDDVKFADIIQSKHNTQGVRLQMPKRKR